MPFDGYHLSKNEYYTLCTGECPGTSLPKKSSFLNLEQEGPTDMGWFTTYQDQGSQSTFYLPFIPGHQNLDEHTVSLNATDSQNQTQYNLHNINALLESKAIRSLLSNDTIPFLVSSGSFAGSGRYAAHRQELYNRTWNAMKYSISQQMNFNMFGIPMTGPDVCGSLGNITDYGQMCGRWIQLATFFPYATSITDPT